MARIGKKQAARILRRVVEKHGPETTYADIDGAYQEKFAVCRYINTKDKPMCIVGVALIEEVGINPRLLRENGSIGTRWNGTPKLQDLLTRGAVEVLTVAQRKQDGGATWGAAVKAATAGIR